jgi:hypothetical protein
VIRKILEGLPGCANILDDILVFGRDMQEHDAHLRAVLSRLEQYSATVRRDKCTIGATEVDFNGHRVSAAGVLPLQSNVEAILNMKEPNDQRQLLRFLCTATYYLKFVPNFSGLSTPLRDLLKADAVWNWTAACQHSFDEIKRKIAEPPILAHFDVNADTIVTCDASATALGACLSQRMNGVEKPVAFASRCLSPAERKYSASEREALACLWASEKWHFYLYGRKYTLVTDHMALKTLLSAGGTGHRPLRLHRWADRLLQYDFRVEYKPGCENVVADCLSRADSEAAAVGMPVQPELAVGMLADIEDDIFVQTIFGSLATPVVTMETVAAATESDSVLRCVREYVVNGWPLSKRAMNSELRAYFSVRHELSVSNNCVVRECRTVIPTALRQTLLELAHEGHPGIVRMKQKCRDAIWWPGIDTCIERYVRDCMPCIVSGKSCKPTPGPLQPVSCPEGPWQKISLDIAGEFMAAPHNQRFLIVAIDHFSKWPEVAACGNVTSSSVIEFLTSLFDRFGLVNEIITDNGAQFVSFEFEEFLKSLGIRHSRCALYAPQSNAAVERFNRCIKDGVKAALLEGKPFMTGVRQVLASYRMTPQSTTGVTPASLMLAFKVITPLSLIGQGQSKSPSTSSVVERVRFKQAQMSGKYDSKMHASKTKIKAGDFVRLLLPRRNHKLAPVYSNPYKVRRVAGNCVTLENGQKWNVRRCLLHKSILKQTAVQSEEQQTVSGRSTSADTDDSDSDESTTFTFQSSNSSSQQRQSNDNEQTLRRSQRNRRPRDFGPSFIRY